MSVNTGVIRGMVVQRPWVGCKVAVSLDGRKAMASGESQWITGCQARADVQKWRASSCAIISGIGSVLQDDSRLTIRKDQLDLPNVDDVLANPPLRVLLDTRLQISLDAAILKPGASTLLIVSKQTLDAAQARLAHILALGEHLSVIGVSVDENNRLL